MDFFYYQFLAIFSASRKTPSRSLYSPASNHLRPAGRISGFQAILFPVVLFVTAVNLLSFDSILLYLFQILLIHPQADLQPPMSFIDRLPPAFRRSGVKPFPVTLFPALFTCISIISFSFSWFNLINSEIFLFIRALISSLKNPLLTACHLHRIRQKPSIPAIHFSAIFKSISLIYFFSNSSQFFFVYSEFPDLPVLYNPASKIFYHPPATCGLTVKIAMRSPPVFTCNKTF